MKFIAHEYQQYAIDYIKNHPVAAVLLEMGLGQRKDSDYPHSAF